MTANGASFHDGILHAHSLERYKTAEVVAVQRILAQADAEIKRMIQDSENLSEWTRNRLDTLLADLGRVNAEWADKLKGTIIDDLKAFAETEVAWQAKDLEKVLPMDWQTTMPSTSQVWAAAVDRPFDGIILEDALDGIGAGRQKRIDQTIRRDQLLGKTTDQIVRDLFGTRAAQYRDGIMPGYSRKDVQSIVRTAVSHVAATARERTYAENDDIIKGLQIVETLDPETCLECMADDGKEIELDSPEQYPIHYNCRRVTVPVLKSWREMGLDIDELPPGTRASLDGQVSDRMTYADWLAAQSAERQIEALGPARYELYKAGTPIDEFTVDGRTLTLDELRGAA